MYCKLELKNNYVRILYIDPFANPNSMGGSQKSLLDIMTEMKNRGNEVILAMPGTGLLTSEAKNRGVITTKYFLPTILFTRISFGKRRYFNIFAAVYDVFILFLSSLSLYILIRNKKPDIVHANQMLISIAAGFACKLGKVPCVWHIRENPADHIPGFILKTYGVFGFLFADRVMVNSQYTANIFRKTALYKKIVVIPIGIENNSNHVVNKSLNSKDRYQKSNKVISIFGRIIPMKGHDILIKSLKILKEKQAKFELQIVAHINKNDRYYLYLLSLIKELNLKSKVQFCDFISDINPILNTSDIIVTSSIESETFGRTIIEAMAAGKPIVATRVGAHPELIEDGITGFLVEPNNPKQLSEKLKTLLDDKYLSEKMGQNGRVRYEKYYTLEQCCLNIENAYYQLIGTIPGQPSRSQSSRAPIA